MDWCTGDPLPRGYALADDGLPARNQGAWARDKLRFLDAYVGPALQATKQKKGHCYYVDLFAGPGLNLSIDAGRAIEYPGSPIRALHARYQGRGWEGRFRDFFFCNLSPLDHQLLDARIDAVLHDMGCPELRHRIHHFRQDANSAVHAIVQTIPTFAYVLVFADIEGPRDLAFDTLRALREQHKSVDLYILYPTFLGMERQLEWDSERRKKYRPTLDRYFGTEEWWGVVERRKTDRNIPRMRRELKELYMSQLGSLWDEVAEVMQVRKRKGRRLYDMLFAHGHEAAGSIAQSARRQSSELDLFDGTEHALGRFRKPSV